MKRNHDDAFAGSQFKALDSSRWDSYGQSQGLGGGENTCVQGVTLPKLTAGDALTYLKQVKEMFQGQREKYDMFLEVMKDFKAQRTGTAGVIARVKELFKGHNKLILGFNTFLPKGYEMTLDEDETPPKKIVEFEEAIGFVNKIKRRFQKDEHVYKSFLDILNLYRKEQKDISEVYSKVAALFEDHPDLLEEFSRFLPDTSAAPSTQNISHIGHPIQNFNERSSATPKAQQIHIDKQCIRRDKLLNSDRDLVTDHPELDDKTVMKVHKVQKRRAEKESRAGRNHDQVDRDCGNDKNGDYTSPHLPKKESIRKSEDFGTNADLLSYDDKDTSESMYSYASSFFEKVKERLGSTDDYAALLKCLHIFNKGIIKRNDLQNLVNELLGKYPDIMEELNAFLERCENNDGFLAGVMNKKSLSTHGNSSRSVKLEDKKQKREIHGAKEKERYREKYMAKSIQELDFSRCMRSTPSYRLLPDDYPIPSATQRSELGAQVLNDHWVSVTSGSEDCSFKHMQRNHYEESLFLCEEDRFELDMLLEYVSSADKRVEELLNSIKEKKNNFNAAFRIEDHFTALNLRCIERLYGDNGLDVIDILHRNPAVALPVISKRLKQKQEEWTKCRADFNKLWAEIYAKNYYKSLDHRSFYFKQQDSKNLSTKSFVTEIKEIKEKLQEEDDIVQAFASGKIIRVAHMKFEYSNIELHQDLQKLIMYSCRELCSTKDQLSKVVRLWTKFVEPLLGVPPQPYHGIEVREDRKANHAMKASSMEKGNGIPVVDTSDTTMGFLKHKKSASNEIENRTIEAVLHTSLAKGDKTNGSPCSDQIGNGKISSNFPAQKEQSNVNSDPDDQVASGNGSFAINVEKDLGRTSLEMAAGFSSQPSGAVGEVTHVPKGHGDAILSSEVHDVVRTAPIGNRVFTETSKVGRECEESSGPCIIEKEEGELSANGGFGEDNFVGYGDSEVAMPKSSQSIEIRQCEAQHVAEDGYQVAGGNNDADADDEDSGHLSEACEDVSGSESASDECSREEHKVEDIERNDVDGKAESEGEAEGMSDSHIASGNGQFLSLSEQFLLSSKPLVKHLPPSSCDKDRKRSQVFYGNDDFFVLFRLHQMIYERILSAKANSLCSDMKLEKTKNGNALDPYSRFMSALYKLLDGSADNTKSKDECRSIFGDQSYVLFTLNKIIFKLVKQLQTVAADDIDNKLLQLYDYEQLRKPGTLIDSLYYANTRVILREENIYRFECSSGPCQLSIQLMDRLNENSEVFAISMDPSFANYMYNEFLSVLPDKEESRGIVLQRNKRMYAGLDELSAICLAMEGVQAVNGLVCKVACNSSQMAYVLDTEDFFIRLRKKKRPSSSGISSINNKARAERFHSFLAVSLSKPCIC